VLCFAPPPMRGSLAGELLVNAGAFLTQSPTASVPLLVWSGLVLELTWTNDSKHTLKRQP
jgi:hypothetical protein